MNTKSDLLLINSFSWTEEKRPCYLPYGILYLAGYVRDKGLSVDIYDRNCDYSHDIQKCISYFEKKKPKIVGLSVLSGPVINDALKISRKITSVLILFRTNSNVEICDQNKKRVFEKPKYEYTLRSLNSLSKSITFCTVSILILERHSLVKVAACGVKIILLFFNIGLS